jgi:uncharacterized protein (DUF4415 family)
MKQVASSADVIDWLKTHVPKMHGYQMRMNLALREYIKRQARGRKAG